MDAGSRLTASAASSIVNTGAIVGASVELQAGQLVANRGVAALIGATDTLGELTILAPSIENSDDVTAIDTQAKPIILGLGRVTLAGGRDGQGNFTVADSVTNRSAIIESGGDMRIYADVVTNTRRTLSFSGTFDQPLTAEEAAALGISLSGQVGTINTPDPNQIGGVYIDPPHSGQWNSDYMYTTYNGVAMRNALLSISPKAQIIAGGNLDTSAGSTWRNYWSDISAAGAINLDGVTLDQDGWKGAPQPQVRVDYSGDYHYRTYNGVWWTQAFANDLRFHQEANYNSTFSAGTIAGTGTTIINDGQGAGPPLAPGLAPQSPVAKPQAVTLNLTVPNSALFHAVTKPGATYLVETDPRFTDYRQWISSSYLLDALSIDPAALQKRLGDGFYEQRLVREQVLQLTGQRFLGNYADEDAQYQALLANAVTVAKTWNLRPGVALSPSQLEQLTSDIAWLVEQEVTLPSGEKTRALVPVVYLAANSAALRPDGAMIAANRIELTDLQGFVNGGSVVAKDSLKLQSLGDLDSRFGQLVSGGAMQLAAGGNVDLTGAQLRAGSLQMGVGRDLLLASATHTQSGQALGISRQLTTLAGVGGIDVRGDAAVRVGGNLQQSGADIMVGGSLRVNVGGSWTMDTVQTGEAKSAYRHGGSASSEVKANRGSSLQVGGNTQIAVGGDLVARGSTLDLGATANDSASISAGGSIVFEAAKDRAEINSSSRTTSGGRIAADSRHVVDEWVVRTSVNSGGDLVISAGKDIVVKGSDVNAQGALIAAAGRDVVVASESERHEFAAAYSGSNRGVLSAKQVSEQNSFEQTLQQGSSLGGKQVSIAAGQDAKILGSQVISDERTTILAARDVAIEAATSSIATSADRQESRSGVLPSGGAITIGKRSQENARQTTRTTAVASTVGSVGGDVVIKAGGEYRQTGSDVIAPGGSADIAAASVKITEAREITREAAQSRTSQSGVSVGISSPVVSGVQSAIGTTKAAQETSNGRMQALGMAAAATQARHAFDTLEAGANAKQSGDGPAPNAADTIGGASLSISLGASKSQSAQSAQSDVGRGATIAAGKNVSITATGSGAASNVLAQGAEISAGSAVRLKADGDVVLKASQNTASERSSSSSSSASVGLSIGLGAQGGTGITASASKSSGTGNGADVTYTNTHVSAGKAVVLVSGADTTLQGAVVSASQVVAAVGGDLTIESLQDTSQYASKQQSIGGSVTIGAGAGGSFRASKSSINSNYESVTEQSGIKSGDGGFQVIVGNDTVLKGGVIASNDSAVNQGRNSFSTAGTLTTSDIQNSAKYSASSTSIGIGVGGQAGVHGISGVGVGIGKDGGSASSTTTAGISGIAGDKSVRSTDAETGLARIFDQQRVQNEVNAQAKIMEAFTREAPKAAANFASSQIDALKARLKTETDPGKVAAMQAEIQKWDEGGIYRVAMHTVLGGLAGGPGGAAGAAASASAAPWLNEVQSSLAQSLQAAGMSSESAKAAAKAMTGLTAAGVGAAFGGATGAAIATGTDFNNRQLHPTETQWIKDNARLYAQQQGISEEEATRRLAQQAYRQVQFGAEGAWDAAAYAFLSQAKGMLPPASSGDPGYMFFATPAQKSDVVMYANALPATVDIYIKAGLKALPDANAIAAASAKDAHARELLSTLTLGAGAASGIIALASVSPTLLTWVITNPDKAVQIGLVTAETGAGIASGAITPIGVAAGLEQRIAQASTAAEKVAAQELVAALKAVAQQKVVLQQEQRIGELAQLFNRQSPVNSVKIGGNSYAATAESNLVGTTKVFDTTGLSAAELEKQVFVYANELAGGKAIEPVLSNGVPLEGRWMVTLENGSRINVRSVSSSGVGRWTIDVNGLAAIETAAAQKLGTWFELKFK